MKKATIKTDLKKGFEMKTKGLQALPATEGLSFNPNIPTHHADIVSILHSSEGLAMISFFSRTPGLNVEECRVSITNALAKQIIDILCMRLDYYPSKPSEPTKKQQK